MKKITIFGGDQRMLKAYEELKAVGFSVNSIGLFESDCGDCSSSDVFLLPVPSSRDGRTVCTPLTSKIIPFSYIEQVAGERLVLYGVKAPKVKLGIDYCADREYAEKNAIPTAEGAIALAIGQTPFTLSGSRCLVIGYGCCGKPLCKSLKALGAEVTAAARREEARSNAVYDGFSAVDTADIDDIAQGFDIIFNTADALLLENTQTKALIIDISTRGCISAERLSAGGFNYIKAPSLPAKTAPETAGIILAQTVTKIIKESLK